MVEYFESRAHKAVSIVVERDKEIQQWREEQMPKALPGFSGRKLPGRSKGEAGKEEKDEEEKDQEGQIRSQVTRGIIAGVLKEADTVEGGVTRNTVPVTQSINVWDSGKIFEIGLKQKRQMGRN